jgi:hypothetical protein
MIIPKKTNNNAKQYSNLKISSPNKIAEKIAPDTGITKNTQNSQIIFLQ